MSKIESIPITASPRILLFRTGAFFAKLSKIIRYLLKSNENELHHYFKTIKFPSSFSNKGKILFRNNNYLAEKIARSVNKLPTY